MRTASISAHSRRPPAGPDPLSPRAGRGLCAPGPRTRVSRTVEKGRRMSTLSIENISMRFDLPNGGHVQALQDVSLELKTGELMSVLGPSGCGKTTLLNILAGFLAPTEGRIILNDHPVTGPDAERGMVFQQGALFEWMSVRDNVSFGPRMAGRSKSDYMGNVDHLLEVVGL